MCSIASECTQPLQVPRTEWVICVRPIYDQKYKVDSPDTVLGFNNEFVRVRHN